MLNWFQALVQQLLLSYLMYISLEFLSNVHFIGIFTILEK